MLRSLQGTLGRSTERISSTGKNCSAKARRSVGGEERGCNSSAKDTHESPIDDARHPRIPARNQRLQDCFHEAIIPCLLATATEGKDLSTVAYRPETTIG
jgi:hypothetical protein